MNIVDLRSDTVTLPTQEMRQAMAQAVVGDDVYSEDPTINRLQEMAAAKMGKEAALFVASGTMGNLVAVLAHCERGDEAIMGHLGHTFLFEGGGVAALGGVHPHTVPNQPDGTMNLDDLGEAIRSEDVHYPISRLIILENTHNRCGGVPVSLEYTREVATLAKAHGLKLHVDGARIFNAAAVLGVSAAQLVADADSVTFCLSKGLCAPVGSVLCGSPAFIARSRRIRKQLGGGMRQAGVLAAAGIVALEKMVDRIGDDHRRAEALAQGLGAIPGLSVRPSALRTNMVFVSLADEVALEAEPIAKRLHQEFAVRVGVVAPRQFRLVTHAWIDDEGVQRTLQAFSRVVA